MAIFVDRHDLGGLTAADIADAHQKDLELQDSFGVRFLTYWFDQARGTGFCLIDAPDAETAQKVHEVAHGGLATDVIEVDLSAVEAFLGRVNDPSGQRTGHQTVDSAFRAVMFTDIVNSTSMIARLGDVRAVEMIRAHDAIVRRGLRDFEGREVKHTGDGIMASFHNLNQSVECAKMMQRSFAAFNFGSHEPLHVRIGIHAGEPVEDSDDLFGTTVHLAARICESAVGEEIIVSDAVRDALNGRNDCLRAIGSQSLRGFPEPMALFKVDWK